MFSERGQPAQSPSLLAFVIILQFAEGLTDRQAADAVRGRIDWKYALGLDLTDPGFDFSILSEFRARLVAEAAEDRLLTPLLKLFQARGLLKAGARQRTDSTHVLAAIRQLNRLELVGETLRAALNQFGTANWQRWLSALRYAFAVDAPLEVRTADRVEILRQIWLQQYYMDASGSQPGPRLREPEDLPLPRYAFARPMIWMPAMPGTMNTSGWAIGRISPKRVTPRLRFT